jgi:peptidoglycan/LPS O-acetylase OafA/YrhL
LAAGVFVALVAVHLWAHRIDPRVLLYWPVFAVAILYQRQPTLLARLKQRGWGLVLLLPLALWVCRGANEWSLIGIGRALPMALIGTLVLFIYAPAIARPLPARTIAFLAYSGFGLYLFHRVTFKAAIALYFPDDGWNQVLYLLLLVLPLTVLIAYAVQTGYDRGVAFMGRGRPGA